RRALVPSSRADAELGCVSGPSCFITNRFSWFPSPLLSSFSASAKVVSNLRCFFILVSWIFFFSSRRRHTRFSRDWSSDVCSSDLAYTRLDAYRDQGGYRLLQAIRGGSMNPDEIMTMLGEAGLKGLGGAGFPAGRKWQIGRASCRERGWVAGGAGQ